MALNNKNVYVVGQAAEIAPTGNTVPTTEALPLANNDVQTQNLVFEIACSASAGAAKAAAYDDLILTELVTSVDNHITNVMQLDLTATVDYTFKVQSIKRGKLADDIFFNDASDVYVIKGELRTEST